MAKLTKSTGTVTLSGAAEKVTFPAVYGWVWVKNMSDADMFVGLSDGISAGADGVMRIPAGECGRVQTDGQDSVYLIGSGNALVVAQNYADCPFKVGGKGGEVPDLSAYAKKTDVPNIKVNEAVNADTVGGLKANQFVLGAAVVQLTTSINEYYTVGTVSVEEQYTPDFPVGYGSFGLLDVRAYGSIAYQTIRFENGKIIHRARVLGATDWTAWAEIYTLGNKPYVTGTATVAANSTTCITNHGFMPSAAMWWTDDFMAHVPLSYSENSLNFANPFSEDTIIGYIIFK